MKDPKKVAAGKARSNALSPERRSEIASLGGLKKNRKDMPSAIAEGILTLGDLAIPCAVLDDQPNTRVITQNGFLKAIGRHPQAAGGTGSSIDGTAPFLRAKNLKEFINNDLERSTIPIEFFPRNRTSGAGGIGYGYSARLLPQVCWVYQDAMIAGKLTASQEHIGRACRDFLKALTNYAIDDLVDRATGYEDMRKMAAIYKMLEACISKDKLSYVKMFDVDFYRHIYRLNGWRFDPDSNARPGVIGKWTNDIYDRIAPGFGDAVRSKVKRNDAGKPTEKMTQYMTPEDGKRRLREMIEAVKALMRVNKEWRAFWDMMDIAYPRFDAVPLLPFSEALPRLTKT